MTEMSDKRFCQGNIKELVKFKISDVDKVWSDLNVFLVSLT